MRIESFLRQSPVFQINRSARHMEAALNRDPADFGSATFAADLGSMAHETQYSRLFRS